MADSKKEEQKPYYKVVADRLIAQLHEGTAPWQTPWEVGVRYAPMNPISGNTYKGANALHLMMQGRSDPRWMTYRQAESIGAQVQKGQRGTLVQYWKFEEQVDVLDAAGRPVFDKDGRKVKETIKLERPQSFCAVVFNGEQIDGLVPHVSTRVEWDPVARAETILANSGAKIEHVSNYKAFYRPSDDQIVLPGKNKFGNAANYYAVALHELGHWTGHETRLARDMSNPFGSEGYAREELRAEIASLMLGSEIAIGTDHKRHTSYVKSWIEVLQDDPLEIMRAAADAEKIKDFVMGFDQQLQQDNEERMKVLAKEDSKQKEYEQMTRGHAAPQAKHLTELEAYAQAYTDKERYLTQPSDITLADISTKFERSETYRNNFLALAPELVPSVLSRLNRVAASGDVQMTEEEAYAQTYTDKERYLTQPSDITLADISTKFERSETYRNNFLALAPELVPSVLSKLSRDTTSGDLQMTEEELMATDMAKADFARYMAADTPEESGRMLSEMNSKATQSQAYNATLLESLDEENRSLFVYIKVPFKEKDVASKLGAQWDGARKSWYIPPGVDKALFQKWLVATQPDAVKGETAAAARQQASSQAREYLAVPYDDRTQAKKEGARWDKVVKSWYVPVEATEAQKKALQRWKIDPAKQYQSPAMNPREEFAQALRDAGFLLKDKEPIMDGQRHRAPVLGDKRDEKSGFYVGHLDGHPAGFYENHRGGGKVKWKSTGNTLSAEERAGLHAASAQKLAQRAADQTRKYEDTAEWVRRSISHVVTTEAKLRVSGELNTESLYLDKKGIKDRDTINKGLHFDGDKMLVPVYDIEGKMWNVQAITPDGDKRFAKNGKKEGCFHVIGGFDRLANAKTVFLVEGFATGASINDWMQTIAASDQVAIVVAFDSGNLRPVAEAIKARHFDKDIIVAGDDDRHLIPMLDHNVGRDKAFEAALHVGGKAIYPVFTETEIKWDPSVPVFTPAQYKAHSEAKAALESKDVELTDQQRQQLQTKLLPEAQLKELAKQKSLTDFNDLANLKEDGFKRLSSQLETAMQVILLRSQLEPLDVQIEQVRVYGRDLILLNKPGQNEDQPFMRVFKQLDDGNVQFVGVFHRDKIERVAQPEGVSKRQEAQQQPTKRARKIA